VSTPDPDSLPARWQKVWCWSAPALTLVALAWIVLNCVNNSRIHFLTPGPGEWIVYPLPPQGAPYSGFELTGVFRRAVVLPEKPAAALLSWRCFTNGELNVNGTVIPAPDSASRNWKSTSRLEVGPLLRQGTNEISVTVINASGPPALSLELKSGDFSLVSDETWEVSVSGSDWRLARAASATPRPGKGNELYLLETTGGALGRCWPWFFLFGAISICGVALLRHFFRQSASSARAILILLAAVWVLLFLHNFPFTPAASGFDAPQHLQYVTYIQDHHRLPDAREGWEMFQPPLYYVLCAKLLDLGRWKALEPSGMMLLRFLSLAIGAANLALVFAGLRLIFPGDWRKPLAGLALAAFLPAQIFLLHYTTNETLSAMFVTAALCLGLHLLRATQPWRGWFGVLGIVLGLALLSKSSAILAVPPILGALAVKLILRRERGVRAWLGEIGAPLLICVAMSGWHYLKLWRNFGNPLIGGWDPKVVASWWQTKGFQTPGYYFSFGDSLTRPFFSGMRGFWDAFYTTLWGDGLLGGKIDVWGRPPWNYDLMAAGFVLALVPTALVLTGLVRALTASFRAASLIWLMLIGLGWLFAFAILHMSLMVPSYAHTKAFFGLPALLPFCALGALGFEFWAGRGKAAGCVLGVVLGIWLVNVYASFWIRPEAVPTELSSAIAASVYEKADSSPALLNVLRQSPGNSEAAIWLASMESHDNLEEAVQLLEQTLQHDPANAAIESALAGYLAFRGRSDEAVLHARRAVELAPEDEVAARNQCALEMRAKNYGACVVAARHALSLNPADLDIHFQLAVALMKLGQFPEAVVQFSAAVKAKPTWPEAQFYLGLCFLDQGKRDDSIGPLREAVRLNPANTDWQAALQYALKGR
jgi:Flp pilus assembly protein TadD